MTDFKVGDRVTVTLTGMIGALDGPHQFAKVFSDADPGRGHYVYLDDESVTVTAVDPESWPPQAGDIWEAEGAEYITLTDPDGDLFTYPVDYNPECAVIDTGDFKALNPRLIRRRGQRESR